MENLFKNPKTKIAHSFINSLQGNVEEEIINPKNYKGKIIRLSFMGDSAKKPIVAKVIRNFNIDVNILSGNINSLHSTSIGNLILELIGEDDEINNALMFLENENVYVGGDIMAEMVIPSLLETIYMVAVSTVFSILLGFPLGILLVITEEGNIWEKPLFNKVFRWNNKCIKVYSLYYTNDNSFSHFKTNSWKNHRYYRNYCTSFHSCRSLCCQGYGK